MIFIDFINISFSTDIETIKNNALDNKVYKNGKFRKIYRRNYYFFLEHCKFRNGVHYLWWESQCCELSIPTKRQPVPHLPKYGFRASHMQQQCIGYCLSHWSIGHTIAIMLQIADIKQRKPEWGGYAIFKPIINSINVKKFNKQLREFKKIIYCLLQLVTTLPKIESKLFNRLHCLL